MVCKYAIGVLIHPPPTKKKKKSKPNKEDREYRERCANFAVLWRVVRVRFIEKEASQADVW